MSRKLLKLADNPVAKQEEEEDLESLLGEDEEVEEEEAPDFEEELAVMRKSQTETSKILLSLTRSVSALVKHVMAKDEEEEELIPDTTTPDLESEDVMDKQEPAYGGTSDQGEPDVAEDTETDPAIDGAGKENAEGDPGLVSLATRKRMRKSKVKKDDASSNFGEKDSDVPGNPAVTPDTKDWPADQTVIPHSDLVPTLQKEMREMRSALVNAGIIKKARARGVGTRTEEPQPELPKLEEQARNMTFLELNRMRSECGDLPRGIV